MYSVYSVFSTVEKGEVEMKYNIERKEKLIRIWITMIRHGGLGH